MGTLLISHLILTYVEGLVLRSKDKVGISHVQLTL